jgi:hypothetical protein
LHTTITAVHHASQLWPTIGRILSALGACAGGIAAYLANRAKQVTQDVHLLVNGQLHAKLDRLDTLTTQLTEVTAERDAQTKTINDATLSPGAQTPAEK